MDYVTPLIPTAVFSDLGTRDDNSEIAENEAVAPVNFYDCADHGGGLTVSGGAWHSKSRDGKGTPDRACRPAWRL